MANTRSTGTRAGGKRKAAASPIKASVEDLQKYYRDMLLIRRFEEKAGQMYGMGLIGGFCHLYIGLLLEPANAQHIAIEFKQFFGAVFDLGTALLPPRSGWTFCAFRARTLRRRRHILSPMGQYRATLQFRTSRRPYP